MTDAVFKERRRVPRHNVQRAAVTLLPTTVIVRVREISVLGVLLQAAEPLEVGSQGCLRLTLSGVAFSADLEVRRVARTRTGARTEYSIAASFVAISPENRHLIERFVKE